MTIDVRQIRFFLIGCLLALVPIFGVNWLIGHKARTMASQHLDEQAVLVTQMVEDELYALVQVLRDMGDGSTYQCGQAELQRMRALTLSDPGISLVAVLSREHEVLCSTPNIRPDAVQSLRNFIPLSGGDVTLSQARVDGARATGLLLERPNGSTIHSLFVPHQMLKHFFDALDKEAGGVWELGDDVLYARSAQFHEGSRRAQIDTRSLPIANGTMRVQVSMDRNIIEASFAPLRLWATVGAALFSAIFVLLIMRLLHHTPARANQIERAIQHNEFVPYYQPVIDVDSGKLVGCEVLVRWIKPDGTMVSPGTFIQIAEQTGLAIPMTRKLMQAVVRDLQKDYASRPALKVGINLFNQHFSSLDIIEDVEAIFGPSSIGYGQLVLEITERAPLENLSQAKVIMRKLQRMGCRLALDDAGTGHGGLAYLQELGLDIVKIDKMFIDQLGRARMGEAITQMLTELANQLDMDVVAEGVERVDQVGHLKRYGIRQAQGYLFAPALPAKQYLALVRKLGVAKPKREQRGTEQETERKAATIRAAMKNLADLDLDSDAA